MHDFVGNNLLPIYTKAVARGGSLGSEEPPPPKEMSTRMYEKVH